MYKLAPFKEEYSKKFFFIISVIDPSDKKTHNFVMYSYVEDPTVIALLLRGLTKYSFVIRFCGSEDPKITEPYNVMSINQAATFFRRLRFYEIKTVTRSKRIEWTEEIEVEL